MSAKRLVIDSSVAFKWFWQDGEASVEQAWALLEAHRSGDVTLCAPALMATEVVNALACKGAPGEALESVSDELFGLELDLVDVDAPLLKQAVRAAGEGRLALYDALFVALAQRDDCELVTADRRQAASRSCRMRLL